LKVKQKFAVILQKKNDGERLAKKFIDAGFEIIVSVGGDGTNHEIINGIMNAKGNTKVALGFLPLGSGGDFTRSLGIKAEDYEKNIDILFEGYAIQADVGQVISTDEKDNEKKFEKYFLNESSFGSTGQIMKNVNSSTTIINADFTYIFQTMRTTLFQNNFLIEYKDESNNDKKEKIYLCAVSNGKFFW